MLLKIMESLETHHVSQEVRQIMNEYASFVTETESGVHGPTAQFWMGLHTNDTFISRIHSKPAYWRS